MTAKTGLNAIGLALGVIAAVCLYYGSQETPWEIQSWKGQTETEQKFRRRRGLSTRFGFVLLGVSFLCQLAAMWL